MEPVEVWIALNMIPEFRPVLFKKLKEFFAHPQEIFSSPKEKLLSIGMEDKLAFKISTFDFAELKRELALIKKHNLKILTLEDDNYPYLLKQIFDPPIVLYVKGEIRPEDRLSMAIVGSRQASFYGLGCSERFAFDLASLGFTIVSGFARGIDTWAHKGALKAGGKTVAVLGSGFNFIYPQDNISLIEEISLNGAVISEFPCNSKPLPFNFPRRNRIISGLSLGVLVVEAGKKSGALITANFALQQNREVFCIPGRQDSWQSWGTNTLIKEGAKLVLDIQDILEELNLDLEVLR